MITINDYYPYLECCQYKDYILRPCSCSNKTDSNDLVNQVEKLKMESYFRFENYIFVILLCFHGAVTDIYLHNPR